MRYCTTQCHLESENRWIFVGVLMQWWFGPLKIREESWMQFRTHKCHKKDSQEAADYYQDNFDPTMVLEIAISRGLIMPIAIFAYFIIARRKLPFLLNTWLHG